MMIHLLQVNQDVKCFYRCVCEADTDTHKIMSATQDTLVVLLF